MSRNRINTYTCRKCGHVTVTLDVDEGTTPANLACRATDVSGRRSCTGLAVSAGYSTDQSQKPEYAWYRPLRGEARHLDEASRHHVQLGGLLLRPINDTDLMEFPRERPRPFVSGANNGVSSDAARRAKLRAARKGGGWANR